ncbi:uncharacterized protein G2W53_015360 [Senna tora]|uniref:Uncharacterized protein n=1 Tax=Senna tora TaxID=362788 RepID=A0A835C9R0_9FABA|nr:uncharacterized protein G2W53_015360 [Senna tora]
MAPSTNAEGKIMELDGAINFVAKKRTSEQLSESIALGRTGTSKDANTRKTTALQNAIVAKMADIPPVNMDLRRKEKQEELKMELRESNRKLAKME